MCLQLFRRFLPANQFSNILVNRSLRSTGTRFRNGSFIVYGLSQLSELTLQLSNLFRIRLARPFHTLVSRQGIGDNRSGFGSIQFSKIIEHIALGFEIFLRKIIQEVKTTPVARIGWHVVGSIAAPHLSPSVAIAAWVTHNDMDDALVPEIWQYFLPPVGRIRCLNLREAFWDLKLDLQSFVTAGTRMLLFGSKEGHDDEAEVEDNIVRRLPGWDVAIEISGMSGHGRWLHARARAAAGRGPSRRAWSRRAWACARACGRAAGSETMSTAMMLGVLERRADAKLGGDLFQDLWRVVSASTGEVRRRRSTISLFHPGTWFCILKNSEYIGTVKNAVAEKKQSCVLPIIVCDVIFSYASAPIASPNPMKSKYTTPQYMRSDPEMILRDMIARDPEDDEALSPGVSKTVGGKRGGAYRENEDDGVGCDTEVAEEAGRGQGRREETEELGDRGDRDLAERSPRAHWWKDTRVKPLKPAKPIREVDSASHSDMDAETLSYFYCTQSMKLDPKYCTDRKIRPGRVGGLVTGKGKPNRRALAVLPFKPTRIRPPNSNSLSMLNTAKSETFKSGQCGRMRGQYFFFQALSTAAMVEAGKLSLAQSREGYTQHLVAFERCTSSHLTTQPQDKGGAVGGRH
ncbi:hypothetical protein B0H14DRAFT_3765157 [Mycena olivaceomarginata]|nr:hypothetical protein B0H14DRAFT_3765157 [Mycena olivaceomarginata]